MSDRSPILAWALRQTDRPIRSPRRTLVALLLLTLLLGSGMARLRFDPSTERVFPEGHPAVETFARFRSAFGGDEAIFLAVEARPGEDVFSPRTLSTLRRLTRELKDLSGVEEAFSLPDVPVLRVRDMQPVLVDALPADPAQAAPEVLERWRREALATPFVDGNLVSTDRRAALALVALEQLDAGVEGAEQNQRIVEAVQEAVASEEAKGAVLHMAGTPLIKAYIMQAVFRDLIVFSGPLLLIALVASGALLRSLRGPLLVVSVLGVSLVLTLGTMGHLGIALDSMNTMVPVLILVIGVADCLHLLVEQRAQAARLGPQADGAATIRAALGHVLKPCFLTTLTTAIGFGSLFTSDVRPVADFGVAAALSSLVAFVVTLLLIPACSALLPAPSPGQAQSSRADRLAALVVRGPRRSLAAALGFTALMAIGWQWVYPDTNFLGFFKADSRLVRDVDAIQARFSGVAPCELLVEGPPGISRRPEVLQALLRFERALEELPIVDRALSAADFLAAGTGALSGEARIPDSPQELEDVSGLLTYLAGGRLPMEQLVSPPGGAHPDHEWLRVSVRAQAVGSRRFADLVERVRALQAEHFGPLGITVTATGTSVVFSQTADRIMAGQVESFLWAFVSITAVMIVALRSVRLGLLSALPNVVPIVALVGSMGYLGMPLNSFNSMVASIAIGIAVDDTIHILTGFKRFSAELPLRAAVQETIAHEGAAIIATSAVLFSGFLVLLLASFNPTANFGLLTAVAIGAALVGDLVLLPPLLLLLPASVVPTPGTPPPPPALVGCP